MNKQNDPKRAPPKNPKASFNTPGRGAQDWQFGGLKNAIQLPEVKVPQPLK